jgi:arsenate reductase
LTRRVLFLCTGNSCRSQMAEAIVNHLRKNSWSAVSAGTNPSGFVHPLVNDVLKEISIEHQGRSKSVNEFTNSVFDLVVTVCEDADNNCPVWLGVGRKIHIGFEDPAKFKGSQEDKLRFFREIRDEIRSRILPVLDSFSEK